MVFAASMACNLALNADTSRHVAGDSNCERQRRVATGTTSSIAGCNRASGANASSTTQVNLTSGWRRRASVIAGI